jgi:hypothetical protein
MGPLFSTYVYFFDEEIIDKDKQTQLFHLILREEPPRSFFNDAPLYLPLECTKLYPSLRVEWIPPSLWQIAVVHAFFHDESIRNGILRYSDEGWGPISYEETLHAHLSSARTTKEIAESFDRHTESIPELFSRILYRQKMKQSRS